MNKTLKTIYEYLNGYTKEEIDKVISELSDEEKHLIFLRYGKDLHNPVSKMKSSDTAYKQFYGSLIPKIQRTLEKLRNSKQDSSKKEASVNSKVVKVTTNDSADAKLAFEMGLLFDLLKNGASSREICNCLNMTPQKLHMVLLNLKNNGISTLREYYANGDIKYTLATSLQQLRDINSPVFQTKTINSITDSMNMKILVMSDLHIGNADFKLDLITRAYNYCAKNGISTIFCCGDFIDGTFSKGKQLLSNVTQQIDYFIKNYPYDKNILTFGVGGDHDFSAFDVGGVNIIEVCNNLRHDIIIGGFNNAGININNEKILLHHHIENIDVFRREVPNKDDFLIQLHGHAHKYKLDYNKNQLKIVVPSLSEILTQFPSALELDLQFKNGYVEVASVKHIYFGDKDILLSESNLEFPGKEDTEAKIKKLSQIEKFNARYNK